MKYIRLIALLLITTITSFTYSQSIEISTAEVIYDDNNNGYIEPTEEVTLNYTIVNNSSVNYSNILIEENFTQYNADFISLNYSQTSLMAGDSLDVQITYQMAEYLMPWELEASLRLINTVLSDTLIIDYIIPVEFNFECSEIDFLSVSVYVDSLYPNIVLELENTSLWSLQYPGFLFEVNDPYFSFSGQIGYYYVFPAGWSYEFWESITVDPNIPENYQIDATVTLITLDSLVMCEFPISFIVNQTATDISEEERRSFDLYPNPVNDKLFVSYLESEISHYRIYTLDGRLSLSGSLNSYNTQIDVSSLSSGMYFIEISGDNSTGTISQKKFTKN